MYKRILIIGQSFDKISGGGITLSNLFTGWEKDKLAVAITGHTMSKADFSVCDNYYCLGDQEHKWSFPLNLLQRHFKSGKVNCSIIDNGKTPLNSRQNKLSPIRYFNVKQLLFSILHLLGLSNCLSRIEITKAFLIWFDEFKPDVVYTQLSTLELINFISELTQVREFKLVIHIMDDWPETISKRGILQKYWKQRIDNRFRALLDKSSVLLSISEGMSDEYKIRYNKDFIPFHNPIDSYKWLKFQKKTWSTKFPIQVLYTGRIGTANSNSVNDICRATDELNKSGLEIRLSIYTNDYNCRKANKLKQFEGVQIYNYLPYTQMPKLLSEADILVLPLDFDREGIKFTRLSMPTKASEYMITGTPTIVYASEFTHLFQHAKRNKWALTIGNRNIETLKDKIKELSENIQLREKIGLCAQEFALAHFEAKCVRKKFVELLKIN